MNLTLTRLILLTGRGSWKRLIGIAGGIAIGVALFLSLWGAAAGLESRDERSAWMSPHTKVAEVDGTPVPLTDSTALLVRDDDHFRGAPVSRIGIALTPASTVELPDGVPIPSPGEYLASAAMIDLIDSVPSDQLGDRFGTRAGELPEELVAGPDSLVIVEGLEESELREQRSVMLVSSFAGAEGTGSNSDYRTIMLIGAIAVFLPVILLVGIVTQLGAAQRSERFQTLRLIGATPRVLIRMSAIEMALTSLLGALAGVALAWALRPLLAQLVVNDTRFFTNDLSVTPIVTALVVLAMVIAATLASARRVQKAGIGPLGITRQTHEKRPSPLRAIPLLAGLAAMAVATLANESLSAAIIQILLVVGFLLTSIGIITSGPWLVWLTAAFAADRVNSAANVIAVNRIRRTPAAVFRSVSGLVLAVFMASVFAGGASVVGQITEPVETPGLLPLDSMYARVSADVDSDEIRGSLDGVEGVTEIVAAYRVGAGATGPLIVSSADAAALGFESLPDSAFVSFDLVAFLSMAAADAPVLSPADPPTTLNPDVLFIRTDGQRDSMERAQTTAVAAGISARPPLSRSELADLGTLSVINSLAALAYVGVAIVVVIAGISLAVATAAAILDRRRVFGLMRLIGMPNGMLRRIVAIEAVVPLLATLAVTIGLGFLVAWMIVTGGGQTTRWPDPRYFVTLAISAVLALSAVFATFGTIRKNTTIVSTRFE